MLNRLSIQSKLILLLLLVSLGSIGLLGWIGYTSGQDSLRKAIVDQLRGIRENKANQLESELQSLRNNVLTLAESRLVLEAFQAYRDAFREIESKAFPREYDEKLQTWYSNEFLPRLAHYVDAKPELEVYLPKGTASRYLQYEYLANNPAEYEKGYELDAADDGTTYSAVHRTFHPKIREIAKRFEWEDVHFIDVESLDIVYAYQKTTEFATNLADGPYANSNLGRMVQAVRRNMARGDYRFADFDFYRPNLNRPSAFLAAPIFEQSRMIGILVVQFPVERISRVMTGNEQWKKEGLGDTGEVYLVGPDKLFRSRSRFMAEDKANMLKQLNRGGVSDALVQRMERSGMVILYLPVDTESVRAALSGEQFAGVVSDYRGEPVLSAAAPIEIEGKRWAIVAEMDETEAYAPIRDYARRVLVTAVALILGATALAVILSQFFVRPIRKLASAARLVGKGNTDVTVKLNNKDELRDLVDAFNGMTRNLKLKTEELERKVRENEQLLLNILPGPVAARRLEAGDDEMQAQTYSDMTVLFADVSGFDKLPTNVAAEFAMTLLNDLVVAFDETAEKFGVEKVKTIGTTYMAVCGLSVQRPDHTNRMLEFAQELRRVVQRFNKERGTSLRVEIGINAGPVVGGIVGRSKFLYDLWGDTVTVAQAVGGMSAGESAILVTQEVYQRLRDMHGFDTLGEVEIKNKGKVPVYALSTDQTQSLPRHGARAIS